MDEELELASTAFIEAMRHRVAQGRDWISNWEPRPMPKEWKP